MAISLTEPGKLSQGEGNLEPAREIPSLELVAFRSRVHAPAMQEISTHAIRIAVEDLSTYVRSRRSKKA
jgi:hypothetical protein